MHVKLLQEPLLCYLTTVLIDLLHTKVIGLPISVVPRDAQNCEVTVSVQSYLQRKQGRSQDFEAPG